MKRLAVVVVVFAACATAPPQQPSKPAAEAAAATRSANALAAVASVTKNIQEPRIRVGMLSDQTTVVFPRIDGGYYLVTDAGASMLRRGFTLTAPLSSVTTRYAVQVSAISDELSASQLAEKLRAENPGLRVDVNFDPAAGARTYAVRNLGQFRAEGYDICPGPACQAYKGFSGEEALSDQAVKETAGLIATYNGQPIDALFTSTCGGETSDVGTMFPGRNEPYLKAARCVELDIKTITGRADSAVMMTEAQANGRIFAELAGLTGPAASWAAGDVEQAVTAAAAMLRYPAPAVRATSSRRGDVLTYLAAVFGFDRYAYVD